MMMSSECALVIQLDVIKEAKTGSDWVICSSGNQYQTSAIRLSLFFILYQRNVDVS